MAQLLGRVLCKELCSPSAALDGEHGSTPSSGAGFQAGSNTPLHPSLVLCASAAVMYVVSLVLLARGEQGSTRPLLRECFVGGMALGYGVSILGGVHR